MSEKLLRRPEVEKRLGVGVSAIYSWMTPGNPYYKANFPKPVALSRDRRGRATVVAWRESDLDAYIKSLLCCEVAA